MKTRILAVKTTENLPPEYIQAGVEPFTVLNVFNNEGGKLRLCSDNGPVFTEFTEEKAQQEAERFAKEAVKRGYLNVELVSIWTKEPNKLGPIASVDVEHITIERY